MPLIDIGSGLVMFDEKVLRILRSGELSEVASELDSVLSQRRVSAGVQDGVLRESFMNSTGIGFLSKREFD